MISDDMIDENDVIDEDVVIDEDAVVIANENDTARSNLFSN